MNSYEFHIGDYYRETRNLSQTEHYIYRSLLDEFYLQEIPLTSEIRSLMRDIGLTSDQKEDLEYILNKFWELTPDGWVNNRANEELARVYAKSETAKANANARWEKYRRNAGAMQAHSDCNADGMLPLDPLTPLPSDPSISDANASSSKPTVSTGNGQVPIQQIINKWNVFAETNHLPKVVKTTTALKGQIRQRWTDIPDLQKWDNFFSAIESNDFLAGRASPGMGRNKPFRSTLLWITKETNFAKIAAGEYD